MKKIITKIFKSTQKCKGFGLVEMLISIFVFVMAVTMLTGTFASFLKNYSSSKKMQKDIENAQYAMNTIAKTIRTSEVEVGLEDDNALDLDTYDYSQGKCIKYIISEGKIQSWFLNQTATNLTDCNWSGSKITNNLISNNSIISDKSSISVTAPTALSPYGKVTVVLTVKSGTSAAIPVPIPIQMSVSLRQ